MSTASAYAAARRARVVFAHDGVPGQIPPHLILGVLGERVVHHASIGHPASCGAGAKTKQIILSVKAGHTNVAHVRDLVGVIDREKAQIAF